VLCDELTDAFASDFGGQVRWETCQTKAEPKESAADHRERASL
jgi:hypothetical protein